MADFKTEPYKKDGAWWIDRDFDDKEWIGADLTTRLTDIGSPAVSVVAIAIGNVSILQQAVLATATYAECFLTKIDDTTVATEHGVIFRTTCANGAQFDKTVMFNKANF